MTTDPVRAIADAVLYEGYILWPYSRSALKNQQRFTFGGVYPQGWPQDRSAMQVECLLEAPGDPEVAVRVRFLQVVNRTLVDAEGNHVDELVASSERVLAWEEATERELSPGPFAIAAGSSSEALGAGRIVRSWEALEGRVEVSAERLAEQLHRVRVRVVNGRRWDGEPRSEVLARTLCSTHAVLETRSGRFVSLTDPPAELRAHAEACRNDGAWPVLVGEPGDREIVLAAPIILEDYPRVAPESPGDFFDGGEIDQLLVLNILALTDHEKREMAATDPRAREILERSEGLSTDRLLALHGRWRQ